MKLKLITIICESMLMSDVAGYQIPGYKLIPFNTAPARFSAESLWCMNSELPPPPIPKSIWTEESVYKTLPSPIMSRFKVRLISNFWPNAYSPALWDQDAASRAGKGAARDPENHQYHSLLEYLAGTRQHEWLIYWPTIGHCGYRLDCENVGIPEHIRETTKYWLNIVKNNLLPSLPKDTPILIHTDHGSVRKTTKDYNEGFAFIPNHLPPTSLDWKGMRELTETILCKQ
jgi:hypothetical protein